MTKEATLKVLKTGGTVLIIGAAALILLPGLMTYVLGLGRILLIVLITLVVATIAGNIIFRLKKRTVQSKGLEATGVPSEESLPEETSTHSVPSANSANVEVNAQD
jgi:UPF0716 family protein affecting phage T7 exclusion